jgi:hypothetical protein
MTQEIKAKVGETLIWYDGPMSEELFLNGRYGESNCYDDTGDSRLYVGFFPSEEMTARYRARCVDLRTVMIAENTERYRFTDRDFTKDGHVTLHPYAGEFSEEILPEPGYYHEDL